MSLQSVKRLTNGNGISKFKSIYPSMNYLTGMPDPETIQHQLTTDGYCLYRNPNLKTVNDLIDNNIPELVFSSYLQEPRKKHFEKHLSSIFMNYQHGTDERAKYGSGLLDVGSGTPNTNYIFHHCELAYTDSFPGMVSFICLENDNFEEGYTPISNIIETGKNLDITMKNKLIEHGIKYYRKLPENSIGYGKTWKEVFNCDSKKEVEMQCEQLSYQYQWLNDGTLKLSYVRPAFIECPFRNELSFGNSILGMNGRNIDGVKEFENIPYYERPYHTAYGNGDEFTNDEISHINETHQKYELLFKWNVGDILILDNLNWSHARYPYFGQRKIVAMMGLPLCRLPMQNHPFACHYDSQLTQIIDKKFIHS